MNRTLLGLLLALGLAVAALFALRTRSSRAAAPRPDRAFAVEPGTDIARVFLADMRGRTLDLRRDRGDRWTIGDSLGVRPGVAESLERALTKLRVDHIPPRSMDETIYRQLATDAIKVEVYDRGGERVRSFLVGPGTADERATYMMVEGERQPYAMSIPGFIGTLRPLFDLRSVDDWRDLSFVDLPAGRIDAVTVNYPRSAGDGFTLRRADGALALRPLSPAVVPREGAPAPRALASYLDGFGGVSLFTREDRLAGRDSLRAQVPFAELRLVSGGGADTTDIALHPVYVRDARGAIVPGSGVTVYYADVDGGESFVRVQARQIQPWLRSYESFFP